MHCIQYECSNHYYTTWADHLVNNLWTNCGPVDRSFLHQNGYWHPLQEEFVKHRWEVVAAMHICLSHRQIAWPLSTLLPEISLPLGTRNGWREDGHISAFFYAPSLSWLPLLGVWAWEIPVQYLAPFPENNKWFNCLTRPKILTIIPQHMLELLDFIYYACTIIISFFTTFTIHS